MTRTAHFDLANGISGDMAISALVHAGRTLGVDAGRVVTDAIASLDLGCAVSFVDDERGGLTCLRMEIKTDDTRHLPATLRAAIARSDASPAAHDKAIRALEAIVSAESVVHGVDVESVHLHELGSADTAADLIGAAVALDALSVEDCSAAPVPVPHGWVHAAHGALPLPAPVTLELLRGCVLQGIDADKELVTPTGAAIVREYVAHQGGLRPMRLLVTGTGAGTRRTERPNICRVLIGEASAATEGCVLLETNIDDQTPEAIGYVLELLIDRGALDAWVTHITMKRSRPAYALSVLVRPTDEAAITEALFRETTTLGIRRRDTTRAVLDREIVTVDVDGEAIRVKVAKLGDEIVNVAPEFADCVAASKKTGVPVKLLYERARERF